MADKTIPSLPTISALDIYSLFIVDSGTETFKVNLNNLALFIRDQVLPAGVCVPHARSVAPVPDGWLLCSGEAVSRSTYARLFEAIGTTYGVGNGTTTFNLPDLRGRVVAGRDAMGGSAANRITAEVAGFNGNEYGSAGGSQAYTPSGVIGGNQSIAHVHAITPHTHTVEPHLHLMNHTHTLVHTHNISHYHQWSTYSNLQGLYALASGSDAQTNVPGYLDGFEWKLFDEVNAASAGVATYAKIVNHSGDDDYYTTGVLDPPSGSAGSNAASGGASNTTTSGSSDSGTQYNSGMVTNNNSAVNSGGMSINQTVNGSNFTLTGDQSSNVQPTMIMNYIIKT